MFNEEGEPNITTVDISAEMDISPGNLYYHFKGKEAIIEQLYNTMEQEFSTILNAPFQENVDIENTWLYLYVVFEQIHKYRFFYRNMADILGRYPSINKRFAKLIKKKRETAFATLTLLESENIIYFGDEDLKESNLNNLSDNMTLLLTYWLQYTTLEHRGSNNTVIAIHRGVFQLMSMLAPYLKDEYRDFYRECKLLFEAISADFEWAYSG